MNDTAIPEASNSVIEVNQLSRSFGKLIAVDSVSFQIRKGAIFGLLGPNGSGKSTIIRMLLGVLPPTGGFATVLGFDAELQSESIKPRIGYMSQQFSLYTDLTVRENIDFYGRIYGLNRARLRDRLESVTKLTGIADRLDQLAGTLSGGWKQRLALACSLIHEPDVLFLDEPTAGIDPVARRDLWDLLFELSGQGVTLLVTTHYMDEAERCTDVGYLFMSKLLVLGKPDELKQLPEVTPPNTKRYEIKLEDAARQLAVLRQIPDVLDATLFGEKIHVLINQQLNVAQLRTHLKLTEDQLSLRPVEPTLEDVFVTLTRAAESQGIGDNRAYGRANASPFPATSSESETSDRAASHTKPTNPTDQPPTVANELSGGMRPAVRLAKQDNSRRTAPELRGLWAILVKEFFHIRRQPSTLFFMLVVPVIQTIIFGYAINMQIEHLPTVVWDQDGRNFSHELIESFENTRRFTVVENVYDRPSFDNALRSGRAQVGIVVPPDYTESLLHGEQAQIQVLIDGSDSQVATTAQSSAQLLGQNLAIRLAKSKGETLQLAPARDESGHSVLPVDVRTRLLYNPDLDSSHFFVPGLVGIILQLVTLFLTSFAIVRERELGTLEQLFVTPVGRSGLLLGKLLPYAIVGFVEVLIILAVMIYVFGVPIRGHIGLLLALSNLFMVCSLAMGLFVSTVSRTQLEAMQFAFVIMLPSILLSGFVFPRSEMPAVIYWASFGIPATYFIEILRGIVLRGAGLEDLTSSVFGLSICCLVVLLASVSRFRKRLG
jgi:ABC transporter DrrB family efflux protein